ncbi:MAG: hypothetical protein SF053_10605 [Bacteroidia bacterium]|nr:hypothetical protein [Bacteroidia bacterium]
MHKWLMATLLVILGLPLAAQDSDILPGHDLYHYLDRLDIRGYTGQAVYTQLKPYGRQMAAEVFRRADTSAMSQPERDWHGRMHLLADDSLALAAHTQGVLKVFYTNRRDLYALQQGSFTLIVNPFLHLAGGLDRGDPQYGFSAPMPVYTNTRGAVVRGQLGNRIGYYTEVTENVARVPRFVFGPYQRTQLLPGEGFVKPFGSENGLDWLNARAYVTWRPNRFLRIKFGQDRALWGHGVQSLLLSDEAPPYLGLTLTARVWRLEYVSHLTQMVDFIRDKDDKEGTYPRKYGAFHQLTYHVSPKVALSLFESVVYNPWTANGYRGFDLTYLNPIIFYRAAEQYIGSPDNALLGLQGKANLLRHVQLYGQILIDDYNFSRRNDGKQYWGNKTGVQAGLKYLDLFGIRTLDLQAEINQVRPYVYQHFNVTSAYSHYGQPLGHALGGNTRDLHVILRYRPLPALGGLLAYTQSLKGQNTAQVNYGGDLYVPDLNPAGEFDQAIGQGDATRVQQLYGRLTWQLFHTDTYLEAEARYRRENTLQSVSFQVGLRAYIPGRMIKY